MPLQVIGTGFGRTGTDSMRTALNMLGVGPTHHMLELSDRPELYRLWIELAHGAKPDWEALFDGYRACMDWPSACYWRELIALNPDARVILTWRSAESWWASFEKTILKVWRWPIEKSPLIHWVGDRVFGGRPDDRAHAIAVYEAHVAEVKATVPAHRLLVHRLGDGWEPLCAHLGVAVPAEPYPSRNSTAELQARMNLD